MIAAQIGTGIGEAADYRRSERHPQRSEQHVIVRKQQSSAIGLRRRTGIDPIVRGGACGSASRSAAAVSLAL
jgi:hypothetical protein